MQEVNLFLVFIAKFEALKLSYAITGSSASTLYGEPRLTNDVDIILDLPTEKVPEFCTAFPVEYFYCPPEEIIMIELARRSRGHFNLIEHQSGFKADIYLIGEEPLQKWALENSSQISLDKAESRISHRSQ